MVAYFKKIALISDKYYDSDHTPDLGLRFIPWSTQVNVEAFRGWPPSWWCEIFEMRVGIFSTGRLWWDKGGTFVVRLEVGLVESGFGHDWDEWVLKNVERFIIFWLGYYTKENQNYNLIFYWFFVYPKRRILIYIFLYKLFLLVRLKIEEWTLPETY